MMFTCQICNKMLSSRANLRRHIANCHNSEPVRMQCPYCNKTRSRQDDLIRHHIVNHHPTKVVEVQNNPGLIKAVPAEAKDKKTKESTKQPKEAHEKAATATSSSAERSTSPLTDGGKGDDGKRDTPALFMRLETMIQETGARNAETPPPKKPKLTEVEMAVASIVSEGSPTEISVSDPYIPECNNAAVQTEGEKKDNEAQTEDHPVQSTEVQATVEMMDTGANAEPTIMKNAACQADVAIPTQRKSRRDVGFHENHCRHGVRKPVHIHIKREVISPSGEVTKTEEIQVNCARCPPPAIVIHNQVSQQAFPQAGRRDSATSSCSCSSSSDSEDE